MTHIYIRFIKLGNIELDDYLMIYQNQNQAHDALGFDIFTKTFINTPKFSKMDEYFNQIISENFNIGLKYNVQYMGESYELYLTNAKHDSNLIKFYLVADYELLNFILKEIFDKINKLNFEDKMKHELFNNHELKISISSIIRILIDNKNHDKYKEILLERFKNYIPASDTYKIAAIYINDYDTIYIKYNSLNELYYKIIKYNFNFLKQILKYDYDANDTIEVNLKNITNSKYLKKSFDIIIY
jgi:hypothetical protein